LSRVSHLQHCYIAARQLPAHCLFKVRNNNNSRKKEVGSPTAQVSDIFQLRVLATGLPPCKTSPHTHMAFVTSPRPPPRRGLEVLSRWKSGDTTWIHVAWGHLMIIGFRKLSRLAPSSLLVSCDGIPRGGFHGGEPPVTMEFDPPVK
jgi:hypothetical protein